MKDTQRARQIQRLESLIANPKTPSADVERLQRRLVKLTATSMDSDEVEAMPEPSGEETLAWMQRQAAQPEDEHKEDAFKVWDERVRAEYEADKIRPGFPARANLRAYALACHLGGGSPLADEIWAWLEKARTTNA